MFNKELPPDEYNKWIVRNGYSKEIPVEDQTAGKENTENDRNIYMFGANVYQNSSTQYYACAEVKDDNWPVFQHFIHLLMEPFIYIRSLSLITQKDVLNLLTGEMSPDHGRLQCEQLIIYFEDDSQKFIAWIKDHVRCDEFQILLDRDSNCDEELHDLFLTGAPCTSSIRVIHYDLSKVIVHLMQAIMDLKNRDEYQMIESILGNVNDRELVEALKDNCAEFFAEGEQFENDYGPIKVIRFINSDIKKN
ncbi:hypothetical protein DdX_18754 [Ditylenchus destructor]|uniref:Uncharacterized protein n=1 Tax=Ditylenchus destructor TaxID=166010 RepID=A0AAD4MJ35_9BILA|nr:hypothetical protein DdX_18754 [Ditylenchus destructor]